jgi:hypothetical protein
MKLNNPHANAVHVHHDKNGREAAAKSITLKPGMNEVSEEDLVRFGRDLANSGCELMEELNDCAEAKAPAAPHKELMQDAPAVKEAPLKEAKVEKLNDVAEAAPKPSKKAADLSE